MPTGLSIFVSIILFIVALSVLVAIHELGHFIAAKSFKVYCSDFSIGFGPKILKIKRKKGETTFSIGIIPFGGYVSMYGEEGELEESDGYIPKERSLSGIKRWKRIIIMLAGIFMNFVLAYLLFLIAVGCFEQTSLYLNFSKNSDLSNAQSTLVVDRENSNELLENEFFNYSTLVFDNHSVNNIIRLKDDKPIELNDKIYVLGINTNTPDFGIYNCDIADFLVLYEAEYNENVQIIDSYNVKYNEDNTIESVTEDIKTYVPIVENNNLKILDLNSLEELNINEIVVNPEIISGENETNSFRTKYDSILTLKINQETDKFYSFGYSFLTDSYYNGIHSFSQAGELWVRSCSLITDTLGGLFVGQGWDQVGGFVAILTQTTSTLINNPFYIYLEQWGMISVNLALFNLLPFPGLDGWQVLVELVEGFWNGVLKIKKKIVKKKEDKKLVPSLSYNESNADHDAIISNDDIKNVFEESESDSSKDNSEVIKDNFDVVSSMNNTEIVIGYENDKLKDEEWHLPTKFKTVMSYLGLGLLFLLMIIILIKDIIGLF